MASRDDGATPVGQWTDDQTWTKTTWIPRIPDDYLADEEGLSREMKIEALAMDDARAQRPSPSATTLSKTELDICIRVFDGVLILNQFLADCLARAVDAARRRDTRLSTESHVRSQMEHAAKKVLAERLPDLKELKAEEVEREIDLRRFKWENRLTRPAKDEVNLPVTWAIIIVMIIVESVLNGVLLAQVSRDALVGGFGLALMISLVNVFSGLAAGLWGWRNTGHIKPFNKGLGWLITLTAFAGGIFFNLFVAHFREAVDLLAQRGTLPEPGEVVRATINHINANGLFGITSIEALALLLVGLGIHLYSAKKGWDDLSDRYPDYFVMNERAKAAREAHSEVAQQVRQQARDAIEAAEAKVNAERDRAYANLNGIENIIESACGRHLEVTDSEDLWVLTGERLLKIYRDQNTEGRASIPRPAYFDTLFPSAEDYRTRNFGGSTKGSAKVRKEKEDYDNAMRALESLRAKAIETAKAADSLHEQARDAAFEALMTLDKALDDGVARNEKEVRNAAKNGVGWMPGDGHSPGGFSQKASDLA